MLATNDKQASSVHDPLADSEGHRLISQALQHHHSSAAFTHSTPNTLLLTFFAQTICSPITFLVGQMASLPSWAVAATYLTKTNHRNKSGLLHKSVQNLTGLSNRVSIPIEMVLVSCSELVDRVLEDLSTVDLLFQSSTCDEAIDNHIHRLADAKSSVDRLWVSCWVPAWVNYSQSQHPTHASHDSLLLPCCISANQNNLPTNNSVVWLQCRVQPILINVNISIYG